MLGNYFVFSQSLAHRFSVLFFNSCQPNPWPRRRVRPVVRAQALLNKANDNLRRPSDGNHFFFVFPLSVQMKHLSCLLCGIV